MGYYPPWTDEQLADIARGNPQIQVEGLGINSLRPALFAHFLEQWGYNIRVNAFQHYQKLGLKDLVCFIGYPAEQHLIQQSFCGADNPTVLFENMYTDIWDNGENGTPVNDENYYALYLYKMLLQYKDYIKIWEIWNEPDFDYGGNAWKPADIPGNWWKNNPEPCSYALKAPVFYYIRLLRISYEVIKYMDPEAYIAIGGLGFPSFLDAVLRNTDDPNGGQTSKAYPLQGGAYFDVMSFHSYPHIDGSMKKWDNAKQGFDYFRHSDAAAEGVLKVKREFERVLERYAYDGQTYPEKHYIITECNIPRKAFSEFMGSEEGQINFMIKTLVGVQKEGVKQFHVYSLSELNTYEAAQTEFQLMGLYEHLEKTPPYQQKATSLGIGYKTVAELLHGRYYDEALTKAMNLPNNVDGAAFTNRTDDPVYVLWAKTSKDQSEAASASYTFPKKLQKEILQIREWDFAKNRQQRNLEGNSVQLGATPIFIY
ncbi:MAG: hypothetical protein AAFP19_05605 [Bacteroidota bacterium]